MSNMPKARELMDEAERKTSKAMELLDEARDLYAQAKRLSVRQSPVRRSRAVEMEITEDVKWAVKDLAKRKPNMTVHQIAQRVGLRNGGRVSEILNGKR
jgi:hypothetical protein